MTAMLVAVVAFNTVAITFNSVAIASITRWIRRQRQQ